MNQRTAGRSDCGFRIADCGLRSELTGSGQQAEINSETGARGKVKCFSSLTSRLNRLPVYSPMRIRNDTEGACGKKCSRSQ